MLKNKATILSTRPLSGSIIAKAAAHSISVDVLSFIETEPVQSVEVQQEVAAALLQQACVVFTSMNAVEAVAACMHEATADWTIYCIGDTTRKLVSTYFGEHSIAGTADNALALADLIIEDGMTDEVLFFCGDQRRHELPDRLSGAGIQVTEIVVYHTVATPHALKKQYHGILFFSPSAVHSFFAVNKPDAGTRMFAIGQTTAAAIRQFSDARISTAAEPGKEQLMEKAINYFINNEQ